MAVCVVHAYDSLRTLLVGDVACEGTYACFVRTRVSDVGVRDACESMCACVCVMWVCVMHVRACVHACV